MVTSLMIFFHEAGHRAHNGAQGLLSGVCSIRQGWSAGEKLRAWATRPACLAPGSGSTCGSIPGGGGCLKTLSCEAGVWCSCLLNTCCVPDCRLLQRSNLTLGPWKSLPIFQVKSWRWAQVCLTPKRSLVTLESGGNAYDVSG